MRRKYVMYGVVIRGASSLRGSIGVSRTEPCHDNSPVKGVRAGSRTLKEKT
jgi:hypothetical protein